MATFRFLLHSYQYVIFKHTILGILSSSPLGNFISKYGYSFSLSIYAFVIVWGMYIYICTYKCKMWTKKAEYTVSGRTGCLALVRFMFALWSAQAYSWVLRLTALCNALACQEADPSYTQFLKHNAAGGWKTCCVGVFWKKEVTTNQRGQWKKSSQFATYHYWWVDFSCRCLAFPWIWKMDLEVSK